MFDDSVVFDDLGGRVSTYIRANYNKTFVAAGGFNADTASIAIDANQFDLVAIGRPFIAHSDYVAKVRKGAELVNYSNEMLISLV